MAVKLLGSLTTSAELSVEDNLYLTDAGTVRGKIELNATDRDDVDIKATSLGSNMKFFTVDTERMRINDYGAVLIGTSNTNGGKADFAVGSPQISWYSGQIQIGGTDMNWNAKGYVDSGIFNLAAWDGHIRLFTQGSSSATSKDIILSPQATGGSATERVRLKGDTGNFGIGTNAPLEKLHVVGKINSSNNIVSNSTYTMFTGRSNRTTDDYGGLNKEYFKANLVTPGPNTTGESSAHGFADLRFQLANSAGNTNMSDIMTLRSGGNVGIGTTSPAYRLDVAGTSRSDLHIFRSNQSAPTADAFIFRPADNTVALGTANAERVRIDSSGNVGIGTNNPGAKLDVSGNIRTSTYYNFNGNPSIPTTAGAAIFDQSGVGPTINGLNVTFRTGDTPAERMRITADGKVGIGTSFPVNNLHVAKSTGTVNELYITQQKTYGTGTGTSERAAIVLGISENGIAFSDRKFAVIETGTESESSSANSFLAISTRVGGGVNERMRITSAGNVGIGTTDPAQKLHVAGNQVRLDTAAGGYYLHNTSGTFRGAFHDNGTTTNIFGDGNGSTAAISIESGNSTFAGDVTVNGGDIYLKYSSTTQRAISSTSTNSLQVGDASVQMLRFKNAAGNSLDIAANGNASFVGDVSLADSKKLILGTGSDLKIYHDGSNSYISDTGTGSMYFNGADNMHFQVYATGERWITLTKDAGVDLFYNDSKKFETTSTGVTVTGDLTVSSNLIVNGTTTTLNTQTVEVEDNILQLNTTQGTPDTATAATSGISIYRGDGVTQASLIFDESNDNWDLTNNLTLASNFTAGGYVQAQGFLYLRDSIRLLNKAANNWLNFATRNTSASEAVYDLAHIGTLSTSGNATFAGSIDTTAVNIKVGAAIHGTITSSSNSLTLNARNTGKLIFQSGGVEKMRINGTNVGIGEDSPNAKLEVTGDIEDNWAGRFENTNSGGYGILAKIAGTSANERIFEARVGSSTKMLISGDGNTTFAGRVSHTGLNLTSGFGIDQIREFPMTFQLTANTWTDTGIDGTDLSTGTYAMQVYVSDFSVGGNHYYEYYSATITWYGGETNSTAVDEIPVHRAGHAPNSGDVQFRTQRASGTDAHDLMLQVKHNLTYTGALDNENSGKIMRFKFRRLM